MGKALYIVMGFGLGIVASRAMVSMVVTRPRGEYREKYQDYYNHFRQERQAQRKHS